MITINVCFSPPHLQVYIQQCAAALKACFFFISEGTLQGVSDKVSTIGKSETA